MGYHEYLELCEGLGAEALFVINCGMSHKEVVPMDQMQEYVQDALDAIEYANGDISTRWGAERAKNGHPKPFNLTMLQVGNENGGQAYDERYALFYDAVKEKYPEIKLVACLWGGSPKSRPIEILDEHYYNTPEFFINRFHQYDTYERSGLEIYVGEYAVTQKNGLGALRGALGEAVFMMGMENNADVVTMTSYAPLFVNMNRRSWSPDLINYDNYRSYGTPSYHVQKLFAQNIGTQVVPVEMKVAPLMVDKSKAGGVGLGTWITQAEFKDMKVSVDGKTVYENTGSQMPDWRTHGGMWKAEEGALTQSATGENIFAYMPMNLTRYTFNVKARKISGNEGFLVLFNAKDDKNFFWWNIGGWGNTRHAIEVSADGGKSELGQSVNGKIQTGKWYEIQVEVLPGKIICSLDGVKIHEVSTITEMHSVFASASRNDNELFIKAVNLDKVSRMVNFNLDTERKLVSKGTVFTMSHPDEWAENSLTEPERVAPVGKSIKVSKNGTYELPANSINVYKLKLSGDKVRAKKTP
jgi:alpha-L-arabinofuranosidase